MSGKPTSYYGDWRNLTAREFVKRLENDYCNDLSRYRFDEAECAKCPFNANCYSLFPDGESRCSNLFCLQERNRQYLVEACKSAVEKYLGAETESRYNEVYTKRSERITERLTALKSGVQDAA